MYIFFATKQSDTSSWSEYDDNSNQIERREYIAQNCIKHHHTHCALYLNYIYSHPKRAFTIYLYSPKSTPLHRNTTADSITSTYTPSPNPFHYNPLSDIPRNKLASLYIYIFIGRTISLSTPHRNHGFALGQSFMRFVCFVSRLKRLNTTTNKKIPMPL